MKALASRFAALLALVLGAALGPLACGGGGGSPTSPPSPTPLPSVAATITITSSGVDQKRVQIPVGGRVAFVNNDSVPHEMASDPHPVHTDCPPLNEVGALAPGRTGVSGALTIARSCGFHDHGQPTNAALQGTVVVQ